MKKLEGDLGGRPVNNDDLMTLQDEYSTAAFSPYAGRGPFIVTGCQVSGPGGGPYTVAPGLVMLDGEFRRFYGMSHATLPLQFQLGAFDFVDERTYETGGTKPCIRERPAVLVASNPAYTGGEFLPFTTLGGKRLKHVLREDMHDMGDISPTANYVASNYDATGLGKPYTEAWGWALCNGQAGRADLRGAFVAGLDPARADYDQVGDTGGLEQVTLELTQIPPHNHNNGSFTKLLKNSTGGNDTAQTDASPGELNAVTGADIQPAGGGGSHENRPPFYVLAYRQWVGF